MARKNLINAQAVEDAYRLHKDDLTPREQSIIERYYAFGGNLRHTLQEIGNQENLTRERVRQIKFLALKKLGVS